MRMRLIRIVPFYWLVLLSVIAMRLLLPGGGGVDAQLSMQNILRSLFLIPKPDGSSLLIDARIAQRIQPRRVSAGRFPVFQVMHFIPAIKCMESPALKQHGFCSRRARLRPCRRRYCCKWW